MFYKVVILDDQYWMYVDMAIQIIHYVKLFGNEAELSTYDNGNNTKKITYIFLGTKYQNFRIPNGSIITNFDDKSVLFNLLTNKIIQECSIWDYSQENIQLLKEKYPHARTFFLELGYVPELDYNITYDEKIKDIDVLFLGGVVTDRRRYIISNLNKKGIKICIAYTKIGKERSELIARSKICLSFYSKSLTECISSSRLTPLLSNNAFVITEKCSNAYQNDKWSQYTTTVNYDKIVETVEYYLPKESLRKKLADKYYKHFKKTCHVSIK
jgi:hypothetical protein